MPRRIKYRNSVLVKKALLGQAPNYSIDIMPKRREMGISLRSNDDNFLIGIPEELPNRTNQRALCFASYEINKLTYPTRSSDNNGSFESKLKTDLFKKAFS